MSNLYGNKRVKSESRQEPVAVPPRLAGWRPRACPGPCSLPDAAQGAHLRPGSHDARPRLHPRLSALRAGIRRPRLRPRSWGRETPPGRSRWPSAASDDPDAAGRGRRGPGKPAAVSLWPGRVTRRPAQLSEAPRSHGRSRSMRLRSGPRAAGPRIAGGLHGNRPGRLSRELCARACRAGCEWAWCGCSPGRGSA